MCPLFVNVCVCVAITCQTDHAMNQRGEVWVALPLITQSLPSFILLFSPPPSFFLFLLFSSVIVPYWVFFVPYVSSSHLSSLPFSASSYLSVSVSFFHSSVIPRGPKRGGRDVEMCVSFAGALKQNPFFAAFLSIFLSQLLSSEVSLSVNFNAKLTCLSSPPPSFFISCFIFSHGLHPGQLYKFQKRELKD